MGLYELVQCDDRYGWIELDGVSMSTPAWCTHDLSALWGTPDLRGDDRLLPGVVGVIAYRRRATVTRLSLPFLVVGQYDRDGVEYPDPFIGLQTNLAYLMANVLLPTNTGDGTREMVWYLPDGGDVTVDVHVLGYRPGLTLEGVARGTLELSVPGGDAHL